MTGFDNRKDEYPPDAEYDRGGAALVTTQAKPEPPSFAAVKIRVYQEEPSTALAPRLVEAERQVEELTDTIRALLLKEQGAIDEAVTDRRLMAEKLGNLLKANVSRVAFQRLLEENSGLKRELAAAKRESPYQQECLELRRELEALKMRLAGDHEGADRRDKMNAEASKIERSEQEAMARARSRAVARQEAEPDDEGEAP